LIPENTVLEKNKRFFNAIKNKKNNGWDANILYHKENPIQLVYNIISDHVIVSFLIDVLFGNIVLYESINFFDIKIQFKLRMKYGKTFFNIN